jgi:hypothetical protein
MPLADVGLGIKPSSGAQLFFFESDGVTPKDTHPTKAAVDGDENDNPVTANTVGVFDDIYITGDYLVTLKDKNNNQIFGLLPINEFVAVTDTLFDKNHSTVLEAQADKNLTIGDVLILADRADARGDVVDGETPDGRSIIDMIASNLQWKLRNVAEIIVNQFGDVGVNPVIDTATIQSAFDFAKATGSRNKIVFSPGITYNLNQVEVKSLFAFDIFAYGASFKLNFVGGPAVTFQGSNHSWAGGRFSPQNLGSDDKYRLFEVSQSPSFNESSKVQIIKVTARNVYQFFLAFMDNVSFPSNSNFRHIISRCLIENFINGTRNWVGSYGVRFDGVTANNSSGNDSRVHLCQITGYEDGIYTNGVRTRMIGGSLDGNANAVHLDGANQWSDVDSYIEFNNYNYRYTNSPTNPQSHSVNYSSIQIDHSIGTLAAGSTNARHLCFGCFGLSLTEELKNVNVLAGVSDCYTAETTTGSALSAKINGAGEVVKANIIDASTGKVLVVEDNGVEIGGIDIVNGIMNLSGTQFVSMSTTFHPSIDSNHNLGTSLLFWNKVRGNFLVARDGVVEPPAASGEAQIFVDTVDGGLKVKFGNGTVKVLATNP